MKTVKAGMTGKQMRPMFMKKGSKGNTGTKKTLAKPVAKNLQGGKMLNKPMKGKALVTKNAGKSMDMDDLPTRGPVAKVLR